MPSLTIPNIPEELERALLQLAAQNGTTPEIEALNIINKILRPADQIDLGTALHEWGNKLRAAGFTLDIKPAAAASGPISGG